MLCKDGLRRVVQVATMSLALFHVIFDRISEPKNKLHLK